jgi:hypothetical protein
MTRRRRTTTTAQRVAAVVVGVLVALPLALAALLATAAPAEAATYRYWTYWWGTNTGKPHDGWRFASEGAGGGVRDQWVLGWRFATSTVSGGKTPRSLPAYSDLCHDTAPTDGSVRVALVIDYGTAADAPPGEKPPRSGSVQLACLVLPASATGARALGEAGVRVRQNSSNGLICALAGYPAHECAPIIADRTPTPTATKRSTVPLSSPGAPRARSTPARVPSPTASSVTLPTTGPSSSPTATTSASASSTDGAVASAQPTESELPAVVGAPASSEQPSGSPVGLVVGAVVVAAIAGSAWVTSRRRGLR